MEENEEDNSEDDLSSEEDEEPVPPLKSKKQSNNATTGNSSPDLIKRTPSSASNEATKTRPPSPSITGLNGNKIIGDLPSSDLSKIARHAGPPPPQHQPLVPFAYPSPGYPTPGNNPNPFSHLMMSAAAAHSHPGFPSMGNFYGSQAGAQAGPFGHLPASFFFNSGMAFPGQAMMHPYASNIAMAGQQHRAQRFLPYQVPQFQKRSSSSRGSPDCTRRSESRSVSPKSHSSSVSSSSSSKSTGLHKETDELRRMDKMVHCVKEG
jgi:hypothetical protein